MAKINIKPSLRRLVERINNSDNNQWTRRALRELPYFPHSNLTTGSRNPKLDRGDLPFKDFELVDDGSDKGKVVRSKEKTARPSRKKDKESESTLRVLSGKEKSQRMTDATENKLLREQYIDAQRKYLQDKWDKDTYYRMLSQNEQDAFERMKNNSSDLRMTLPKNKKEQASIERALNRFRTLPKNEKQKKLLSLTERRLKDEPLREKLRGNFTDDDLRNLIDVKDVDGDVEIYTDTASLLGLNGASIGLKGYPSKERYIPYDIFSFLKYKPFPSSTKKVSRHRQKYEPQSDYKRIANTKNPRQQLLNRVKAIEEYGPTEIDYRDTYDWTEYVPKESLKFSIKNKNEK